jgi:hypothetical protein
LVFILCADCESDNDDDDDDSDSDATITEERLVVGTNDDDDDTDEVHRSYDDDEFIGVFDLLVSLLCVI